MPWTAGMKVQRILSHQVLGTKGTVSQDDIASPQHERAEKRRFVGRHPNQYSLVNMKKDDYT